MGSSMDWRAGRLSGFKSAILIGTLRKILNCPGFRLSIRKEPVYGFRLPTGPGKTENCPKGFKALFWPVFPMFRS